MVWKMFAVAAVLVAFGTVGAYAAGEVEVQKPEVHKPEMQKPEVHKPEVQKPEIHKAEVQMPEIHRAEVQRPERVEHARPERHR